MQARQFQKLILDWFQKHGRKHLPWQQDKTPYRVWVSEIMLQQTQVSTVIPYFERFMQTFPDLTQLAKAEEDAVLHLWSGLGYYSRALNLHRAAKMVMEKHAGKLPNNLLELQKLPGIGASTAGAILAIAYNKRAPILDGNVKRVLTRFHGINAPINEKKIENKLWEYAIYYTPSKKVADYTQAMMDLGATLCTRSQLRCDLCPLNQFCCAHQQGVAALLPRKKKPRQLPIKAATFVIIKKDEQVLLRKRSPVGIWGGLWSLPELKGKPDATEIRQFCRQQFKMNVLECKPCKSFRHTFSHYHLDIFPVLVTVKSIPLQMMEPAQTWYQLKQPQAIGLPQPVKLILQNL